MSRRGINSFFVISGQPDAQHHGVRIQDRDAGSDVRPIRVAPHISNDDLKTTSVPLPQALLQTIDIEAKSMQKHSDTPTKLLTPTRLPRCW